MRYNEFCIKVKEAIQEEIGSKYNVRLQVIDKLNGTHKMGVIIEDRDIISPIIYLDYYYEKYTKGILLSVLCDEIMEVIFNRSHSYSADINTLFDFNNVKDKICLKIVNYANNKKLLKDIPYVPLMDLAIIFIIVVSEEPAAVSSITINNNLLDKWNVSKNVLHHLAMDNYINIFGISIRPINDVILNILEDSSNNTQEDIDDEFESFKINKENKFEMYIYSNKFGINGAANILFNDKIKNLSDIVDCDFYILPSSIHELILIPVVQHLDQKELQQMVREINNTQVPMDEVLSNNIYYFDKKSQIIKLLTD